MGSDRSPRKLTRSPITEALVDLRIAHPVDIPVDAGEALMLQLGNAYPRVQKQFRNGVIVSLSPDHSPTIVDGGSEPHGLQLLSADGRQVVQCQVDGFTFNLLAPYPGWTDFRASARAAWDAYLHVFNPGAVKRIAIRTINRIELPLSNLNIDDYFHTRPAIAAELDVSLSEILMRVVVHSKSGLTGIVTLASEPVSSNPVLPVLLDIDVFSGLTVAEGEDEHEVDLWVLMDELRRFKDDLFFSSITDKTRQMYS